MKMFRKEETTNYDELLLWALPFKRFLFIYEKPMYTISLIILKQMLSAFFF
jgi:hypothetical protein